MRWITGLSVGGLITATILALGGGLPFNLPMPTHAVGWVTPTCGLTRGSTAIARGDFALAWHYNPVSFLAMGFGVVGLVRATIGSVTGRWVTLRLRLARISWALFGLALLALWLYQQTNAVFIMTSRR